MAIFASSVILLSFALTHLVILNWDVLPQPFWIFAQATVLHNPSQCPSLLPCFSEIKKMAFEVEPSQICFKWFATWVLRLNNDPWSPLELVLFNILMPLTVSIAGVVLDGLPSARLFNVAQGWSFCLLSHRSQIFWPGWFWHCLLCMLWWITRVNDLFTLSERSYLNQKPYCCWKVDFCVVQLSFLDRITIFKLARSVTFCINLLFSLICCCSVLEWPS